MGAMRDMLFLLYMVGGRADGGRPMRFNPIERPGASMTNIK